MKMSKVATSFTPQILERKYSMHLFYESKISHTQTKEAVRYKMKYKVTKQGGYALAVALTI